ncbi:PIR protein [Plasmodium sp. gorilla clade G1]|nr:PIR protein [Plasmodium sp. gorilla clade G1]
MKLHYSKILLFSFPLNTLKISSYVNNKNKTYVTSRIPTNTSRVLSECGINTSIYDNDEDMKSVKENFDRQTSQRFEEYEERLMKNRKKCKEQCDKDIQKIILKDKIEKSLEEKVEKYCFKCGCGLGVVAASVGIIGPIAVNEWTKAALITAESSAIAEGTAAGEAARIPEAIDAVISGLNTDLGVQYIAGETMNVFFTKTQYTDIPTIAHAINIEYEGSSCLTSGMISRKPICSLVWEKYYSASPVSVKDNITKIVEEIVANSESIADAAAEMAKENAITAALKTKKAAIDATYASCQIAIIASVVAILVIVLVMVIIYLILRYRRKKKVNKKLKYTKLLNQ